MLTINDTKVQYREIRDTLDMANRVPTDGCSSFSETSTNGCFYEIPIYGYHGEVPIDGFIRVDVPIDGYQDNMETSTNGCSSLYVGDIEIYIEEIVSSTHSFEHRDLSFEGKIPRIDFHFTS